MTPLASISIVEVEGLGPGPLAGRILADMGAQVTVLVRPGADAMRAHLGSRGDDPMRRGKEVRVADLKTPEGLAGAQDLIAVADGLIEAQRPGVLEKLGLGPARCAAINPRLVYGRMTGWGQEGPLARAAGHDLNYVALTGLLSLSANRGERPIVPPTVVGDAAGALGLAFGMVCALLATRQSGRGCVVDGAIVDIVAMLGSIAQWIRGNGQLDSSEPSPFHDSPFYVVYACADGRCITLGALEPQFYALLLQKLEIRNVDLASQYDRASWPQLHARLAGLFASEPRDYWCALLEGSDVCFAPVLSMADAARHPHNVARGIFTSVATEPSRLHRRPACDRCRARSISHETPGRPKIHRSAVRSAEGRPMSPMDGLSLRASDVTLRFGGVTALQDIAFDVGADELVALIGPNGAGSGENIHPAEVEQALSGHPGLACAVGFGVPGARWGEAVRAVCVRPPGRSRGRTCGPHRVPGRARRLPRAASRRAVH